MAPRCFYSLSCETYSGTRERPIRDGRTVGFYSLSCETYSGTVDLCTNIEGNQCFYSLSCETYSGTDWSIRWVLILVFLFAVVRDVQRNESP